MITANRELLKRVVKVKKGDKSRLEGLMSRALLTTQDSKMVEESVNWAQWTKLFNGYTLTILGFINGILDELTEGKVLVRVTDNETGETKGWEIRDKWW